MTDQATYELSNYDRLLRFRGVRIAHASSRHGADSDRIRWTELDIYVTSGGQYVVHKLGRSRVYHAGPNACSSTLARKTTARQMFLKLDSLELVDMAACPKCQPGSLFELNPAAPVIVETERGVTATSATAAGVVESCYNQDQDQVTYLPKVAIRALQEASLADPAIRDAFMVEEIA